MSHIITLHNNQPTVSHRVIAENADNKAQSIKELLDDHKLDFEEFGVIRFETEKGKGRPTVTYFLNEQQATLLLTYLKNSSAVRAFKVALVKEFYKLREEVYQKKVKEASQAQIVVTTTTDREIIGTLEQQVYMLKNENRELRRAMNRMSYNEDHLKVGNGIKCGKYVRVYGRRGVITVVAVKEGKVFFDDKGSKHSLNAENFSEFFKPYKPTAVKLKEMKAKAIELKKAKVMAIAPKATDGKLFPDSMLNPVK